MTICAHRWHGIVSESWDYKFLLYPISASSASYFTTVLLEILRAKGGPGFDPGTRGGCWVNLVSSQRKFLKW